MANNYFCVDFGESLIKISDVKAQGHTLEATALAAIPLNPIFFPSDTQQVIEKQGQELGAAVAALKIHKKNVDIVLPDSLTFNQIITMPYLKDKEMLSAIRYQADQFIPLPLEEINLDVEILEDDKKGNKKLTLICAAPKRVVEKVQQVIEYAGLVPTSIETEIGAIGRLLETLLKGSAPQNPTTGAVFINLNQTATSFYFFDLTRGLITLSHTFNRGYNIFVGEIATNLNVADSQAVELLKNFGQGQVNADVSRILTTALKDFAQEVQRFILDVQEKTKMSVGAIYLFNEAYRFNSLDIILGKYLGIPATRFDLYPYFQKTPLIESHRTQLGYFLAAAGGNLR